VFVVCEKTNLVSGVADFYVTTIKTWNRPISQIQVTTTSLAKLSHIG